MITVKIELMAAVRNPFESKQRKINLQLESSLSIQELLLQIGFNISEISWFVTIVNGKRVTPEYQVQNNDIVFITLPIGGG